MDSIGIAFAIIPLFIIGTMILIFGVVLFVVIKVFSESARNKKMPVIQVKAVVVSKRTKTSGHSNTTFTKYYATFELENRERMELAVSGTEIGMLAEGDAGMLTFQGTKYLAFERWATLEMEV